VDKGFTHKNILKVFFNNYTSITRLKKEGASELKEYFSLSSVNFNTAE
jgi:hypothetical protein